MTPEARLYRRPPEVPAGRAELLLTNGAPLSLGPELALASWQAAVWAVVS